MANTITIGTAANLLFGYQPVWNPNGQVSSPFFQPPLQPLKPQNPVTEKTDFQHWSGTPLITLHGSAQSLVSEIYSYGVLPVSNDPQDINVPTGPLSLNDADSAQAIAAAGTFLGLDFSMPGNYMLVVYERWVSTTSGDYTDGNASRDRKDILTPDALAILDGLPRATEPTVGSPLYDSKLNLADARKYLEAMARIGTHFVTRVFNGDKMVQVFVYGDDKFKTLQAQFDADATVQANGRPAVSGHTANSWIYFTSPVNGAVGFVDTYGALTTISRDPALTAAIKAGKWANGYVPDNTPSIFAASKDYSLFQGLTQQVPYACELTPLSELIPSALVQGPWDRLVAGGLTQKYGNAVVIPLRRPLEYDWARIFPQTSDAWASGIVTPVIDIYQERVDLAEIKMMGADIIGDSYTLQSFSCFAQVVQATSDLGAPPISLPSNSITMVAQIIDTTQAAQTPVLSMSAKALQQLTIACEDMYGTLIFQSPQMTAPGRKTALDGFLMETPDRPDPATNRYLVDLAGVLTDPPAESVLKDHSQSVEFSVTAGEALLQAQGAGSETVKGLEVAYLNWLARIIPEATTDEVLANARVRALYLANAVATFGMDTVFVPYVTYDSYSKYVGDLVTQATTLSGQIAAYQIQLTTTVGNYKVMTSIEAVNDNVRSIGGVLTQYFQVLADGRQAMDQYYANIINQLDTQLTATLKNIDTLQTQLGNQQAVISNLGSPPGIVQQFEKDYVQYEKDEVFKATMGIVTGLFSLGVAFAGIPGAAEKGVLDALKALKDVYDKLQAVMQVLSQLSVIEKVSSDIGKINQLANSIQSTSDAGDLQMPSQVDLDMIPNNVEAALVNVPDNSKLKQDKANLIAAVRNLVIIGSALLTAQSEASRLLVEIANTQRLKTINSQQQAKMSGLTNALNLGKPDLPPDLAKVDLIGMTGQLQFQLKQVLSTLAKVLEQQNGAIQFTYFGIPAPITSFSLNQLLGVISSQDANIINAIQQLNPQPQRVDAPITVSVPSIPYKELINGNFKRLSVHMADPGFLNYVMVRIDRVIPRVKGVKSTASGDFELSLETQAQPFFDRDPERQPRTFASTRRIFGPYVYNVETGAAKFGTNTGTFANQVTHLTPFTDWTLSFPAKSTNKDIQFDDLLVDIELDFYVTAIYNDPVESLRRAMLRSRAQRRVEPFRTNLLASPNLEDRVLVSLDATGDRPSLSYLEGQMYQNQDIMGGWDAAFSMLSGPVNAFLNQQFQAYLKALTPGSDSGLMPIKATYFGSAVPSRYGWSSVVTEIDIEVTNPLLQFIASSDQATVQQYIEKGSVKTGSVDVAGTNTGGDDDSSPFSPKTTFLPAGPLTFTADLATNELVIPTKDVLGLGLGSIFLSTTGKLPAPLGVGDDSNPRKPVNEYYVVKWSSVGNETRIQLSDDPEGMAPVKLTDAGSGTQSLNVSVFWNSKPSVVDTSKHPYVFANVQLATVKGIVDPPAGQGTKDNTLTVTLDFPNGSFVLKNIHVEPDNWDPTHESTSISEAIANYYANNEIRFDVQTINTKDLASDADLTPTRFKLHAMNTNGGNNVLQVLMMTTGKNDPKGNSLALFEPVAYDPQGPVAGVSDFMISLMISPELTFQHIFVDSFNRGDTNFKVEAIKPPADYEAWKAQISTGSVTAPVPFKSDYTVDGTKTQFRISASSNDLVWDLTGLTFSRSQSQGIALYYSNGTANPPSGGTNVDFQYRQYLYAPGYQGYPGTWYWTGWKSASAMAYVTMNGHYPLEVTNQGENQMVKFSTTAPDITIDKSSDLKPTGACECNDNDVKIALMDALSSSVPDQLQKNMEQISFKPLSIMALESLLFPANQLIAMSVAGVPSAALVVGSFLAQVRKTSPTYTVTIPAAARAQGSFGGTAFQNGGTVNSVTKPNQKASFSFKYGEIGQNMVDYTINIETGKITPQTIAVVYQSDLSTPQNVVLLLPGFEENA